MTTIKSIIRSVSALKPQIVRVSAIRPCIAQAAPELLSPPHLKVHASHPWLRGTGIHASAAQSSSRSSAIEPAQRLLSLRIHAVPIRASCPQVVCVPHELFDVRHLPRPPKTPLSPLGNSSVINARHSRAPSFFTVHGAFGGRMSLARSSSAKIKRYSMI